MTAPVKNPTIWRPPSGDGSVAYIGFPPILENVSKLPILENIHKLPILTGPTLSSPKNPTIWTEVG
jgi:hypothetical protein